MKIKSYSLLLLLIICSLLFTGCSNDDGWHPAGMKKVSNEIVDYDLYFPNSWVTDLSTGVISGYVSNTDRSNVTMMAFNLENENLYMTVDEYWEKYEAELLATFPDMTYVRTDAASDTDTSMSAADSESTAKESDEADIDSEQKGEDTLLGSQPAKKYVYTATITGTQYQFMQVICIHKTIAYVFTYTAIPTVYSKHLEEVNEILLNFSFKG